MYYIYFFIFFVYIYIIYYILYIIYYLLLLYYTYIYIYIYVYIYIYIYMFYLVLFSGANFGKPHVLDGRIFLAFGFQSHLHFLVEITHGGSTEATTMVVESFFNFLPQDIAGHSQTNSWFREVIGKDMGMDQYLLIPCLGGWTSIYQLFWCSPGVQGFDTLPYINPEHGEHSRAPV